MSEDVRKVVKQRAPDIRQFPFGEKYVGNEMITFACPSYASDQLAPSGDTGVPFIGVRRGTRTCTLNTNW